MIRKNKLISILIVIILIISGTLLTLIQINDADGKSENDIVPSNLWTYQNLKNRPEQALVLSFEQVEWQVLGAACITPAYFDRGKNFPIIFNDGSEDHDVKIPHETLSVIDLGNNIETVTESIAKKYWSQAEIILIAINYEQVLWIMPIASLLSAPILVNPDGGTLNSLGTKCVIIIGENNIDYSIEKVINLKSKEEIWSFQLELYETMGQKCNYIVLTNPNDVSDSLDSNIHWPYLSLNSAPLSAFRYAIVQTGDYTANKSLMDKLANGMKQDDETYNQLKPFFNKVKKDSYNAEKFLLDNGHNPEYLALVGGSNSVPDYIFDIHENYLYWSGKIDYVFSPAPYGNIENKLDYFDYPYQEVEVGRIIGHSIADTSLQLTRTFFYKDFLSNGKYRTIMPSRWEKKASVVDGHRVNQPNFGGPLCSPDKPYFPAGEIFDILNSTGFESEYYIPRNVSDFNDNNLPINEILNRSLNSSIILLNAHGGVPGKEALLEIGMDSSLDYEYTYVLNGEEIIKNNIAPSLVYLIGCDTGSTAFEFDKNEYLTLGFIHSGAVAYIAPETYQTICYWDKAPFGPEASQAIYFFENVLKQGMSIGKALTEAKWKSYLEWINESTSKDDIGPITLKLYGDPAFKPYIVESNDKTKNNQVSASRSNPGQGSRQKLGSGKIMSNLKLLWDETQTLTGSIECENISISNFGRLIIEDADIHIKGTIEISGYGSLFVSNSSVMVSPPPIDAELSVFKLSGNAIARFFNSEVTFDHQPTPTKAPFLLSEDSSTVLFDGGLLNLNLPSIPRDESENYKIKENVKGTAGTVMLTGDSIWVISNLKMYVNLNFERINDIYLLMGAWYMGTLQGNVKITFNTVQLNYNPINYLFEPIKGKLEIIDSTIKGSLRIAGITELSTINSSLIGEIVVTDQSITSIIDSTIKGNLANGLWTDSDVETESFATITNSIIEGDLSCGGKSNIEIYDSIIQGGIFISSNGSALLVGSTINGFITVTNSGSSNIIDSKFRLIKLLDYGQIRIENPIGKIDSIILINIIESKISLVNSEINKLDIDPTENLEITMINSTILKIKTFWNTTSLFELQNSTIVDFVIKGDNNNFSFKIKDSIIPDLSNQGDSNNIIYIFNILDIHVTQNNHPIACKVDIFNNESLVVSGYTDEYGDISFPLLHRIFNLLKDLTINEYLVQINYLGFSENRYVNLNRSQEISFSWTDSKPPKINLLKFGPKTWNSNWGVTVQSEIVDDDFISVTNVSIKYTTDGGNIWKEVQMKHLGNNIYEGIIPGQSMGTEVQFYIVAYDSAGNFDQSPKSVYQVGIESIILVYVFLIIIISIFLTFFKKWISKHRALKNYYYKFYKNNRISSINNKSITKL